MAELSDIASPQELAELSTAGFTPDEINSYRIKSMQKLADAGYSKEEIRKFILFGKKHNYDPKHVHKILGISAIEVDGKIHKMPE